MSRRLLVAGCLALSLGTARDATFATSSLRSIVLWAWERPEDLRFLTNNISVAFLDRTLVVSGDAVESVKRRQPLRVSTSTPLIAVVRIEARGAFGDRVLQRLSSEILESARLPRVFVVQIDFDATRSQRPRYLRLLRDLRARLPHGIRLSVTALASWCTDDPWIAIESVDEIVPMVFRMGPDARRIAARLQQDRRWPVVACNNAIGVSLDERWHDLPSPVRVYVFNPRPWREEDWSTARRFLGN